MDSKEIIESAKLDLQNIDTIIDTKHNPVVSAFISLIKTVPYIGDLIDDSLEYTLTDFQSKKQQQLLEAINNAPAGIVTSEIVNDVEFIMGFAKTKNAVDKLSNGDKAKYVYEKIDMGTPVAIDSIVYFTRNDNNYVLPNDDYELLYFDKGWHSMGTIHSNGYSVEFENVPQNALYLLKDKSRGKEERVFTVVNKKQIWW